MNFKFAAIAAVVLLIGVGTALAVVANEDPTAPSVTTDENDRQSDIERDLEAVLNDDDDAAADETDDDADDTKGTKTKGSGDTGTRGGSGKGGGSGDD